MLTLNQIIDQIKTLADAHYQIAEVGVGTIAELQAKPDRSYPLLWLSNEGGTLDNNYKVDNIRLIMFGRVTVGEEGQDDDASELEVLSDMQLILLDFLNYFHQQHGQDYVTDKSNTLEHFTERTNDRTAGYSTVLELKQFYDWNKCEIPQSGASIPPTVDGLTLYDFCDADVIARLTADQIACLESELCSCADATVQLNGSTIGTIPSGDTDSFPVLQDGSPVGSWNGSAWIIPPLPPPSLAVALSASTIERGQTLTITATPTGLTPTNYFGFTKCAMNSLTYIGEQASNVFNWSVDSPAGANTLFVQADDGSDGIFNVGGESLTVTTNYLLNYTDFLACWSTIKRGQTFSDPILRTLRSSDSDEADFTPVTGTPEVFDGSAIASNAVPATHDGDTFSTFISTDNGTTPNIYDQAGGNYDGSQSTLSQQPTIATSGTIETVDGFPVYSFDGSNDNIVVFDDEVVPAAWQGLSDAITIIAWVSPDAFNPTSGFWFPANVLCEFRVIASDSSVNVPFAFGFTSAKIQCGFTDNSTTNAEILETDAVMTTGELQQIAVTIDGDTVKFYRNGESLSEQTITTATGDRSVGALNSTLRIGSRSRNNNSATNGYNGDVAEVIIAPSVLSDQDILNIYNFYQS